MTGASSVREISRYLDAIVEITRKHDSQELLVALAGTLSSTIEARCVRLLALSNPENDTEFSESNIQHALVNDLFEGEISEPRRLDEDPDLVASVRSAKPVSRDTSAGRRLVFPVSGKRNVRALLGKAE